MRRLLAGGLTLFLLSACGDRDGKSGLAKQSPLYRFATGLAVKMPSLDPQRNQPLATCRFFTVRVDSFILEAHNELGRGLFSWAGMDSARLLQTVTAQLDKVVERKLLLRHAQLLQIKVAKAELDTILLRLVRQNGGKQAFRRRLAQDGLTVHQLKLRLAQDLVLKKQAEQIKNQPVQIEEQALRALYEQERMAAFRHILVINRAESDSSRKRQLEELEYQIKLFVDFAKLARKYSDDSQSGKNGGLYQNVPRGHLPPLLDEVVFTAPLGVVQHVWDEKADHFVLVIHREKETRPFDQVRGELERQWAEGKKQKQYREFLDSLKRDAQIHLIHQSPQ
ncbi:MAG TPA: peptidylprolyl isomerase [bacterium]|nr:peptidylprolyl isomerase [bacterium]